MKIQKQNPRIKEVESESKLTTAVNKIPPQKCWVVDENRIGCFHVSSKMLDYIKWEVYQDIFKQFMIVRCNIVKNTSVFEYVAFSPLFDKVSKLERKAPLYEIIINNDESGVIQVTAKQKIKSKIIVPNK